MNRAETKMPVSLWEYPVYVVVTIFLLLIGAVLWLFGMILRLALLFKRNETNG